MQVFPQFGAPEQWRNHYVKASILNLLVAKMWESDRECLHNVEPFFLLVTFEPTESHFLNEFRFQQLSFCSLCNSSIGYSQVSIKFYCEILRKMKSKMKFWNCTSNHNWYFAWKSKWVFNDMASLNIERKKKWFRWTNWQQDQYSALRHICSCNGLFSI
jgi:hypothetical protein